MQRLLPLLLALLCGCAATAPRTSPPAPVQTITVAPPGSATTPTPVPLPPPTAPLPPAPATAAEPPSGVQVIPLNPDRAPVEVAPLPPAPPEAAPSPPGERSRTTREGVVALLLPLKSASFKGPAEAVHDGFMAAQGRADTQAKVAIKVFPTGEGVDDILNAYREALQAGSGVVVGPLTRNSVTALAQSGLVGVPTLALNSPEAGTPLPDNLYLFGLSGEAEARQVAHIAWSDGRRSGMTVEDGTPLAKRIHDAFIEEWRKLGGRIVARQRIPADPAALLKLRDSTSNVQADMLFLAAAPSKARLVRPYLPPTLPLYATSLIVGARNEPQANFDLNGVRFVDMPWLLQLDHPAVMAYPRRNGSPNADLDRLYALGIDAFRIAEALLHGDAKALVLDGVTGRVSLSGQQFAREPVPATFREGQAVAGSAP